jgi:hypothetical protein
MAGHAEKTEDIEIIFVSETRTDALRTREHPCSSVA